MKKIVLLVAFLSTCVHAGAQPMRLEEVISAARSGSVPALQARAAFVSDYWAWRAYQASRLPSLSLYGTLGSFDRSLRLLQNYETGEMVYTPNYNMENSLGLRARQNITFTGGTLNLYTDLTRIDQFGSGGRTWYAQPVTLSYSQPLFAYNQFKWDKLISPKEYERAKRIYLESMEDVTLQAVDRFFEPDIPLRPILQTGRGVLEVKWDELLPSWLYASLQLDGLQWTNFSKYYLCRSMTV